MAAIIRSLRNGGTPIIGASRDDLRLGDLIAVNSVDVATTYAWTIAYKPQGSTAVFSGDVTQASPGSFTVDLEGPYLIRLTVNLGLPTEHSQFVRLRLLTILGDLRLVAAGEQSADGLPIPVDASPQGWADDQNFNLINLLDLVQPIVTSGRVFYVDANVGTEGFGQYDKIQDAIDAAVVAGAALLTPWAILVRPGTYLEDITFQPHVHVIGWPGNQTGEGADRTVLIQAVNVGGNAHQVVSVAASDRTVLSHLTLLNVDGTVTAGAVTKTGPGTLIGYRCGFSQVGVGVTVGPALDTQAGTTILDSCEVAAVNAGFLDRKSVV